MIPLGILTPPPLHPSCATHLVRHPSTQALWKRSWPKPMLTCSVMLVVVGCIIAGIGDLAFDAWAYAYALSSVVIQALYLLLVEFQASVCVCVSSRSWI